MNHHEWRRRKETFEATGYYVQEGVPDEELPMLRWDAAMSDLPPEILRMIFDLHDRVQRLEEQS